MYRTIIRCTKKNSGKCLNCKFFSKSYVAHGRTYGNCKASDGIKTENFNVEDFTCKENKSFSDYSEAEMQSAIDSVNKDLANKALKKWANSYYCKADAKAIIKARKKW